MPEKVELQKVREVRVYRLLYIYRPPRSTVPKSRPDGTLGCGCARGAFVFSSLIMCATLELMHARISCYP